MEKKPSTEIFKELVIGNELGKVLQHTISEEDISEFVNGYIHDFTRMSYNSASSGSEEVAHEYRVYTLSSMLII